MGGTLGAQSKYCWRYQTKHLSERGYGIMCPDLLGYGGTSKPHDYKEYAFADMVVDLAELLDAEGLSQVVVVGHDCAPLSLPPVSDCGEVLLLLTFSSSIKRGLAALRSMSVEAFVLVLPSEREADLNSLAASR